MSKYRTRAIDIVGGDHDWKRLCVEIAKHNPAALCAAVDGRRGETVSETCARLVCGDGVLDRRGKVAAIKELREAHDLGLVDAKNAIEAAMEAGR